MMESSVGSDSVVVRLGSWVRTAVNASWAGKAGNRLQKSTIAAINGAASYRWFTREPEESVVIINLRETYAFRPVVAILDRVVPPVTRAWAHSYLERLATTATGVLSTSRVVQLAGTVLAPPETDSGAGDDCER
jgi:hypothetical protein